MDIDSEVDSVEHDINTANNAVTTTYNAIQGSLINLTEEEVYNAMMDEITTNPAIEYIEFVLPIVNKDNIDVLIRDFEGVVGNAQIVFSGDDGIMVMEITNVTIDNPNIGEITRELSIITTAMLDTIINQHATPGYNLVRVKPKSKGLEVIVED